MLRVTIETIPFVPAGCPLLQTLSLIHSMSRNDFESLVTTLAQAPKLTNLSLEHYYDALTLKDLLEIIDCLKPKLEQLRLHCAQSNRGKGPLAPPMQVCFGPPVLNRVCGVGYSPNGFG